MYGKANILIYDDENIKYYHGKITEISEDMITDTFRIISGETIKQLYGYKVNITTSSLEKTQNIQLDETTMRRIAKYNKEAECERLSEEIEKKQKQIKELDNLLKDKEKRWNRVKEYIKRIYEINPDEYEDDYYD